LKIRTTTTSSEGIRWGPSYPPSLDQQSTNLISYLPMKSGQPVEPGWPGRHTPPRRASGAGLGGVRRSPSLRFFQSPRALSERSLCRSSREARRAR